MVDVQQRALGALEQQAMARGHRGIELVRDVGDQRLEALALLQRRVDHRLGIDVRRVQVLREHEVVIVERLAHQLGEARRVEQVLRAHRTARDLVFVGRADAATRRADLGVAALDLTGLVECDVVVEDQWAIAADHETRRRVESGDRELVDLGEQRLRREHDAVADVAGHVRPQDARGDRPQDGLLAVDHQRVTGVVAALEAHHAVGLLGQPVDDLALAFVAPLGTDDDDVLCHDDVLAMSAAPRRPSRRRGGESRGRSRARRARHHPRAGARPLRPAHAARARRR